MKAGLSTALTAAAVAAVLVGEVGSSAGPWLTAMDALAGIAFLASGVVAATQRYRSVLAASAFAAGILWFAANHVDVLLYAWRPAMVVAVLSVMGRRLGRHEAALVGLFVIDAAILPVAREPGATLALSVLLAFVAAIRLAPSWTSLRRSVVWPEAASFVLALAMALPALASLLSLPVATSRAFSFVNSALIAAAGAVVLAAVIRRPDLPTFVRDTVIELSDDDAVDASGLVALVRARTSGAASQLEASTLVAVDAGLRLLDENHQLHVALDRQVDDVRASRRRLVDAADEERARLEQRLDDAVTARLARLDCELAALVDELGGDLEAQARRCLAETRELRSDLDGFVSGLHPRLLASRGLVVALRDLASRSPVDTEVSVCTTMLPVTLETTLWYACAEALTNVVKHAAATEARLEVYQDAEQVTFCIVDNGVGGAGLVARGGLAGLADRLHTVGGAIRVESGPGGTCVEGWVPWTVG